ncbi:MAG TPA: hypothetical protein ENH46_05655 [Candidatus Pacearchaeota archaeon]|nr:hypothetical protein [Candidatus Pacearchaeota archaeon]
MATKDWRNLMYTDYRISYLNKKGEKLVISPYGDIEVFVAKITNPTNPFISRRFKTKSQALQFAKAYMRKH